MIKPIWEPSPERIERANINRFLRYAREQTGNDDLRSYAALYDFSIHHPERFWPLVWEFCGIRASGTFHEILVSGEGVTGARWFPGVRVSYAQNLLRFRDERTALIAQDEQGRWQELSYAELQQQVARLAPALRELGLRPGDRATGVLANSPEAVISMLACMAAGAVWSACAADADAADIAALLRSHAPQWIFVQGELELPADLSGVQQVIRIDTARRGEQDWQSLMAREARPLTFELGSFEQPLCALRHADGESSLHSAGGSLIQHLKDLVLQADLKREDHVLVAAQPGEALWYWLASALAVGSTLVLAPAGFDPARSESWDLLDEYAVSVLACDTAQVERFCAGTASPRETHKLLALKTILAAGAPLQGDCAAQVYARVKERLLLMNACGDAGGLSFLALGCAQLPVYTGEAQCRGLGLRLEVLDSEGRALREQPGRLACLAPFPGLPLGLLGDADGSRFKTRWLDEAGCWRGGESVTLTVHEGLQWPHTAAPTGTPA
jgi:acetoacetyl-CoA synthetase